MNLPPPIRYDEPLFRPPSEGRSLILQATIGCSWNRCSFCEMYRAKRFRPRPVAEVQNEIDAVAARYRDVRRVFLADGNALVLSNRRLLPILDHLRTRFPTLERVSSYALPGDIARKSIEELAALRTAGLGLLYVGVESGDDEVLRRVDKGQTQASAIAALNRAGDAGIARSVMILNGLGGRRFSAQHAENSAAVLNATHPEFAATLVVSFPIGDARFRTTFGPGYEPLDQVELFAEVRRLLACCEGLTATRFRSNHASNHLLLKGLLNRDRDRMVAEIDAAIAHPEQAGLRPEWARGL